jgi:hypothetical protein
MDTGQGAQRFHISETNPNDAIGGGGCLCSEGRCGDRGGPYAVFYVTETDSNLSPHVVLCAPCARGVVDNLDGETIKAGEPVVDADSVLIAETLVPAHENPVTEDEYPEITPDDDELAI